MADETNQTLDANSRLKARARPSVPPRQPSLLKRVEEEPELESEKSLPERETRPALDQSVNPVGSSLKRPPKLAKLVSFTLRVDETVDKELKLLCSEEGITKETFLEAAYLVCKNNHKMMEDLLEIARERRRQRKEKGIQRRAKTMTRYLAEP